MQGVIRKFAADESGAVAGLYAVALIGLIAVGGVGFDYARMAGLDSELQNAADQAALAAATQLDGEDKACTRAINAGVELLTNITLLSNQAPKVGDRNEVTVNEGATVPLISNDCDDVLLPSGRVAVRFFKSYNHGGSGGFDNINLTDENTRVVQVDVDSRTGSYAFTPIVGAIFPEMRARAVATLGTAICKVPPLMMCQNSDWTVQKGQGLRLVQGSTSGSWTPGNYGFLAVDGTGLPRLQVALGANVPLGNCQPIDGVTTEPGEKAPASDAINTRFDVFESSLTSYCAASGGKCSPAPNIRSDLIHPDFAAGGKSAEKCGMNGKGSWELMPIPKDADAQAYRYLPDLAGNQTVVPKAMGLPRDRCHAVSALGNCSEERLGDGNWAKNLYLLSNYNETERTAVENAAAALGFSWPTLTRYEMYQAELKAMNDAAASFRRVREVDPGGSEKGLYSYLTPQCAAPKLAGENQPDRRLGAIAVIDCANFPKGLTGREPNVPVMKWVEIFFVEPSVDRERTSKADIYVEIVREVDAGEGDKSLPVRKDKPYLIE